MSGIAGPDRRRWRTSGPRRGALIVAVLAVTACSGGDDPDADATTLAPPTTPTPTTAAPTTAAPTTTAPPATTALPVTQAPTNPPSTTTPPVSAPVSEPVVPEDTRRVLVDLARRSWELFNDAKLDPTDDAKVAAIGDVRMGASADFVIEVLGRYRTENWRSVANPTVPASITPYPETLRLDPSGDSATMRFCQVNSNIVVEVGGNPDGTDAVIADGALIEIGELTFTLVDGAWFESNVIQIDRQPEVTVCPVAAG